jgi:hypothetical protein
VKREHVNSLLVFQRQIVRRITGAVQTEEGWRIINNDELEKVMRREDIVKYKRAQMMKRWGHLNRMEQKKKGGRTQWNAIGTRSK